MYGIVHKRQLAEGVWEFGVSVDFASRIRAGQFFMLRTDEDGERIPLTFSDWDADEGWIRSIFMRVGKTTHQLSHLEVGDSLADVVGPLGKPTEVDGLGRVAVVGGGVGAAVAYPVARAMREAGNEVTVILGARSADLLVLEDEIGELDLEELIVTTDDGSRGRRGLVTEPLDELCAEGSIDHAMAIGPVIMMRFCAETCASYDIPCTVSLNPIMVDGTGMCGACRVSVGGETRFACVDGPDFEGSQVDFAELMSRQRVYADDERLADARYAEECACRTRE